MATPYFHNRLEDSTTGLTSVHGPDLVKYGTPVFAVGKFGNGLDAQSDNNLLVTDEFNFDLIGKLQTYTIEFWMKPDWSMNGTTGAISTGVSPLAFTFKQGTYTTFSNPYQWIRFYNNEGLYIEGTSGLILLGPISITAGNWYKIRIVLDASSSVLGGTYKVACYVNNVELSKSTYALPAFSGNGKIFIGGFDPANAYLDGVLDNPMIYDFATLDYTGDVEFPYAVRRILARPIHH